MNPFWNLCLHCNILIVDRPGLRNLDEIRKLNEAVVNSLQKEILRSQAGNIGSIKEEIPAISILINKRHTLRSVQTAAQYLI